MGENNSGYQWEYGVYELESDADPQTGTFKYCNSDSGYIPELNTSLYELGKQGWEGFAVNSAQGSIYSILMKRRIQN